MVEGIIERNPEAGGECTFGPQDELKSNLYPYP